MKKTKNKKTNKSVDNDGALIYNGVNDRRRSK